MMKLSKNIRNLKKAALVAFASFCLSFIFISNSSAQEIKTDATSFANKEIRTSIFYSQKSIVSAADEKKNAVCDVQVMRKRYQESCYSCMVVKTLTEAFMKGCSKVYPVSRDAGSKIAIIGAIIWIVIFAMKNVSSFTSLEPANNVNDLLVFLFKVLVALVFINAGIGILVQYIVEPILMAGADYGMGIVVSSTGFDAPTPDYSYNGIEVISTKSINKLFGLNQAIDKVVSENLVIGNTLICHSMNAGAWVDASLWIITLKIPNFWIMICGAAIWFAGFMLTLSISYYVLDVSFKLGFAIMLLPVAIGLWPFEATKKKLSDILSIIFKSAAIFAFLAITTSYSLNMISAAIGGVDELYTRIANDDATWISEKFEITGSFFILIIFAYLYSLKMIGGTIGNYVNKFFSDSTFGNASPIHNKATQATDIAKQKGMGLAKGAAKLGGKAAVAGGKAAVAGAKGVVRGAIGSEKGGTTIVGNARKAVGRFAQFAGRKASQAGDLNRKLSQNLQNFSDKQVAKGTGKKNILHLAAGGLAGKMAAANANLPGVAKASDISSSLGAKMQKWGAKEEEKGKDFNAKYRGVKTHVKNTVKNAINEEVDLVKSAAKQGTAYVKNIVKDGVDGIKDDAKQVGNAVKNTKVYQAAATGVKAVGTGAKAVGSVAERTGTALSNGYVAATTTTKGAIVGAALKTTQAASEIGNKAVNLGKRTAVYKAGKYTVNKTVQGASYVGNKTVQGAQVVRSTTIDTAQRARDAVVDSAVYKGGEKVVDGIVSVDRSVRDAAITARSTVGSGVGATRDFAQGINNSVKGAVNDTLSKINDQRKRAGAAVNAFIYKGLGGEKLAEKLSQANLDVPDKETPIKNNEVPYKSNDERVVQELNKKEEPDHKELSEKKLDKKPNTDDKKKEDEDKKKREEKKRQEDKKRKDQEDKKKKEDEDRKKREEEQKKEEEEKERRKKEQDNKVKFENEYRSLLRKYNITDISSVDSLSGEKKSALKQDVESLKSKYQP